MAGQIAQAELAAKPSGRNMGQGSIDEIGEVAILAGRVAAARAWEACESVTNAFRRAALCGRRIE
jgi:hypothetical protein